MRNSRHLFCLPIEGRIDRKDYYIKLREENKEAKDAELSVRKQNFFVIFWYKKNFLKEKKQNRQPIKSYKFYQDNQYLFLYTFSERRKHPGGRWQRAPVSVQDCRTSGSWRRPLQRPRFQRWRRSIGRNQHVSGMWSQYHCGRMGNTCNSYWVACQQLKKRG